MVLQALSRHPAPGWQVRVDELKSDRANAEQRNDRGLLGAGDYAIVVRRPGDAPEKGSGRDRHGVSGIEGGAAIDPPDARDDDGQAIRGVSMRRAHKARIPLHENDIGASLVQAAVERRHLGAVWRKSGQPRRPLDRVRKSDLSFSGIDRLGVRGRDKKGRKGAEERRQNEAPAGRDKVRARRRSGAYESGQSIRLKHGSLAKVWS